MPRRRVVSRRRPRQRGRARPRGEGRRGRRVRRRGGRGQRGRRQGRRGGRGHARAPASAPARSARAAGWGRQVERAGTHLKNLQMILGLALWLEFS